MCLSIYWCIIYFDSVSTAYIPMYNFYTPVTNRTEYNGALTRHNELFDLKSNIRHSFPFLIFLLKFLLTHHFAFPLHFHFYI